MIVSMAAANGSGREPGPGGSGRLRRTSRSTVAPVTSKIAEMPRRKARTRRADPTDGMNDLFPGSRRPETWRRVNRRRRSGRLFSLLGRLLGRLPCGGFLVRIGVVEPLLLRDLRVHALGPGLRPEHALEVLQRLA